VLFSENDQCWKIADFGTASDGTSKQLNTTRNSRGTQGYRSPEVLSDNAVYNNKADIFALGCILYEVTTGQKSFPTDWAIRELSHGGGSEFEIGPRWPSSIPGSRLHSLGILAQLMLLTDPRMRPSAKEVREQLSVIRTAPLGTITTGDVKVQVGSRSP
jgi:serine/threonine protein kinase